MNHRERDEYIKYRLEKSDETFEVAELLIENEKWNSAVNRLYYSVYYAISALLVKAGIKTKTHTGVKTQFFLNYVKPGIVKVGLAKAYSDIFDWRQKVDYVDFLILQKKM